MVNGISRFIFLIVVTFSSAVFSNELPDFTELIEKSSSAVVKINTTTKSRAQRSPFHGNDVPEIFRHLIEPRQRESHSIGSGFFISSDGYLVTNNHVVENANEIVVRMVDRREFDATIIGVDPRSDLALLKVEAENLPYLKFAKSEKLKVGEWVIAIGSPFGLDFSASQGIVSAIGRSIPSEDNSNYVPFIQTDVAINPGNSGGPLFNLKGEVVGVNSQIYTQSGGSIGLSFAIPSDVATNVVDQLKKTGRVDRGWLGVVIQEVDKNLADTFGLKKPQGALIAQMERDGPADKSGLKVGDVIVEFNDIEIMVSSDLPHAVGITPPGERVPVKVYRQGKEKTIGVVVGSLEGEPIASFTDKKQGDRLGLKVSEISKSKLRELGFDSGVLVEKVATGSPAASAGIQPGDVIVELAFKTVEDVSQYKKLVKSLPKNKLLSIRFSSNGQVAYRSIMIKD